MPSTAVQHAQESTKHTFDWAVERMVCTRGLHDARGGGRCSRASRRPSRREIGRPEMHLEAPMWGSRLGTHAHSGSTPLGLKKMVES